MCGRFRVGGFATGLAEEQRRWLLFAIGVALFFLSDSILAGKMFSDLHFWRIGDVIWLTYGPAQMLIVYTAAVVLPDS